MIVLAKLPTWRRAVLMVSIAIAACTTGTPAASAFEELPDSAWIGRPSVEARADTTSDPVPRPEPASASGQLQQDLARADSIVAAQGGPTAGSSRLLLSWNAPWGQPRASRTRRMSCRNDGSSDTLYFAFECGRESPTFNGFFAEVRFRTAGGADPGLWWSFGRGGANQGQLLCDFGPTETMPGDQPWTASGQGAITWEKDSLGVRMRLVYAVPYQVASPVRSARIYTLARVVFFHRRALAGCDIPVCIEWSRASLAFALRDESEVAVGERHVTTRVDDPAICGPDVRFDAAPAVPRPRRH